MPQDLLFPTPPPVPSVPQLTQRLGAGTVPKTCTGRGCWWCWGSFRKLKSRHGLASGSIPPHHGRRWLGRAQGPRGGRPRVLRIPLRPQGTGGCKAAGRMPKHPRRGKKGDLRAASSEILKIFVACSAQPCPQPRGTGQGVPAQSDAHGVMFHGPTSPAPLPTTPFSIFLYFFPRKVPTSHAEKVEKGKMCPCLPPGAAEGCMCLIPPLRTETRAILRTTRCLNKDKTCHTSQAFPLVLNDFRFLPSNPPPHRHTCGDRKRF